MNHLLQLYRKWKIAYHTERGDYFWNIYKSHADSAEKYRRKLE